MRRRWIHLSSLLRFQDVFVFFPWVATYRSFLTSGERSSVLLGVFWLGLSSCSKSWRAFRIWAPNLRASWRRSTVRDADSVYGRSNETRYHNRISCTACIWVLCPCILQIHGNKQIVITALRRTFILFWIQFQCLRSTVFSQVQGDLIDSDFNDHTHSVRAGVLARDVKGKNVSWQHQVTNPVTVISHLTEKHTSCNMRTKSHEKSGSVDETTAQSVFSTMRKDLKVPYGWFNIPILIISMEQSCTVN